MKKSQNLIPVRLLAAALLLPAVARALTATYTDSSGNAWIYSYNSGPIGSNPATITGIGSLANPAATIPAAVPVRQVTAIAANAFGGVPFTSITIPGSVTSIGAGAFASCSSLASVALPASGLATIGPAAFAACPLRNVTLPNTVTSIGAQAFLCPGLTAITVISGGANDFFSDASGVLYGINSGQMTLLQYPLGNTASSYAIPATINDNGSVPVTGIAPNGFSGCASLTGVTIPGGVTLGSYAFSGCGSLATVDFLGNAPGPGTDLTVFQGDSQATAHYLSGTTGWSTTFDGIPTVLNAGSLQVAISPPGAVSDGAQWQVDGGAWQSSGATVAGLAPGSHTLAFSTVANWTSPASQTVTVSDGATTPASGSYGAWYDYAINNDNTITLTYYTGPGGAVTVPATYAGLPVATLAQTFSGDQNLTSVTLPASVTSLADLGAETFADCNNLTAIDVAAGNPVYSSVNGILFDINQATLVACPPGLAGIFTIPGTVTSIGDGAFYSSLLTGVTIPNSVTSIGAGAFNNCAGLTAVTIPGSVSFIGNSAFAGTSLTAIAIPGSVTSIGEAAFFGTGLTTVTIPGSVTSLGPWTFGNCSSLTAINVASANPAYSSVNGVLFDKQQKALLEYPLGNAATSYAVPPGVTDVDEYAFLGCPLTSVTIPGSVTSIAAGAFAFSTRLASLVLGNGVVSIGSAAFESCGSLGTVAIPASVTSIGDYAFAEDPGLQAVYVSMNLPSLGTDVFGDPPTIYYPPGASGWAAYAAAHDIPAVLWNPQAASPGVQNQRFGFTITGTSNNTVVVEASASLANPAWIPLQTNTLTGHPLYFSDAGSANCQARFYRLRSPQ